jgi:hypothetical protein
VGRMAISASMIASLGELSMKAARFRLLYIKQFLTIAGEFAG